MCSIEIYQKSFVSGQFVQTVSAIQLTVFSTDKFGKTDLAHIAYAPANKKPIKILKIIIIFILL